MHVDTVSLYNKCIYSIQIILGAGMMYDPDLERGVKKKILPEPNPSRVELPKIASVEMVVAKAKELYFRDEPGDDIATSYRLADSNGVTIVIDDPDKWNLWDFYQQNGLVPSMEQALCNDCF